MQENYKKRLKELSVSYFLSITNYHLQIYHFLLKYQNKFYFFYSLFLLMHFYVLLIHHIVGHISLVRGGQRDLLPLCVHQLMTNYIICKKCMKS